MGQVLVPFRINDPTHILYNVSFAVFDFSCIDSGHGSSSSGILFLKTSEGLTVVKKKFLLLSLVLEELVIDGVVQLIIFNVLLIIIYK